LTKCDPTTEEDSRKTRSDADIDKHVNVEGGRQVNQGHHHEKSPQQRRYQQGFGPRVANGSESAGSLGLCQLRQRPLHCKKDIAIKAAMLPNTRSATGQLIDRSYARFTRLHGSVDSVGALLA
jgi:hypothetical protein